MNLNSQRKLAGQSLHTINPMNNSVQPLALLMLLMAGILSGCALPGPTKTPAQKTYFLQSDETPNKSPSALSDSCALLRISSPVSSPGFTTSRMAYSVEPQRVDYFAYHEWVDSPAKMLATLIESQLDHRGLFRAVVKDSPDIRTHYRLDSELQRLLQIVDADKSWVVLEVKVKLIAVADHTLLNSRTFAYSEPASQANPEAGVAAANRAAQNFLDDLVTFLTETLDQTDCNQ